MTVDELLAAATAQTGLDDFGEDTYREGLDRLVTALDTEASLSPFGDAVLPLLITKLLVNRLHVEDWYRRHPEIGEEPIVAPLIGLAQEPGAQAV